VTSRRWCTIGGNWYEMHTTDRTAFLLLREYLGMHRAGVSCLTPGNGILPRGDGALLAAASQAQQ
jgi:hypothetical protein